MRGSCKFSAFTSYILRAAISSLVKIEKINKLWKHHLPELLRPIFEFRIQFSKFWRIILYFWSDVIINYFLVASCNAHFLTNICLSPILTIIDLSISIHTLCFLKYPIQELSPLYPYSIKNFEPLRNENNLHIIF